MRRAWLIACLFGGLLSVGASSASAQNCVVVNGVTTCAGTFRYRSPVLLTQGTIIASAPQIDGTATWNNGGVTFTAWRLNITDTASATASLLMDLQVGGTSKFSVRKDGLLTNTGNALIGNGVTAPLLMFSCATSSCPMFKRNTTGLQLKTADDLGFTDLKLGSLTTGTGSVLLLSTPPTISSGFGSSPSIAANNGTAAFTVNVGTGGAATTGVIGLPTATTGWICTCTDITTASATVTQCKQTASSAASATIGEFAATGSANAWAASDIVQVSCFAY